MNKPTKKSTKQATDKPSVKKSHHIRGLAIVLFGVVILSVLGTLTFHKITVSQRLQRINAVYQSIDLDDSYLMAASNVFGEKQVYSWDKGRTSSSYIVYYHGANVDVTAAELKKKIEAAGFEYFEEPYPGSADVEWHFKSKDGVYVRLTVSSKSRNEAIRDANLMHQDDSAAIDMDPNAGPAVVMIKVNLDDNNE